MVAALDAAGVPVIEVTHGDGLGGSSYIYGLSGTDERELIGGRGDARPSAKIAVLMLPGVGVEGRHRRRDAISVRRSAASRPTAPRPTSRIQHFGVAREVGLETVGFLMMAHTQPPEALAKQARIMVDAGCQCVYVVDSAGALILEQVADRVAALVAEARTRDPGRLPRSREPRARRRQLGARLRAGAVQIDGSTRRFGAGAGNTPLEALVAVCSKLGIETGVDVLALFDVAEDVVRPVMDEECTLDRLSLIMGYAGVYSSFLKHAYRAAERYDVSGAEMLMRAGERQLVGGQEDQLIDIALELVAERGVIVAQHLVDEYTRAGWWGTLTLSERISELARERPDAPAFVTSAGVSTWAEYDAHADELAASFAGAGLEPADCMAVVLADGPETHHAYVGAERAGIVVVGIGERAGVAELDHLMRRTEARAIVTYDTIHGHDARTVVDDLVRERGVPIERHVVLGPDRSVLVESAGDGRRPVEMVPVTPGDLAGRAHGPNDLFFLNSTSGTTGLPKCVMQFQNRWMYFHQLAVESGELASDDVFMSVVPAPYGFGLWTQHFTPALLGAPTALLPRFDAGAALRLIEDARVTVLACVSTQFIMMLNAYGAEGADLSSLRAMYTGGENVPYHRAAEFEERTGAVVLQFFGSNETGAFTYTSTADDRDHRLRTAGA